MFKKYHINIIIACVLVGIIIRLTYKILQVRREVELLRAVSEFEDCQQKTLGGTNRFIKKETTKIAYLYHAHSGWATYTKVGVFPDRLVWEYEEIFNACHLKDSCQYDVREFDELINKLSMMHFSLIDNREICDGGAGYQYSFEADTQCYLSYSNSDYISGDYYLMERVIREFIEKHKPQCQILFGKYSGQPHENALKGEFKVLPKELQVFKVE